VSEEKDPQVRVVDRRWWAQANRPAESDRPPSTKPTYVEELEQRVQDANRQLQSYVEEHRKSLDDFEQARVRIRRDVARDVERGKRTILAELLEVLDNLDRAIAAARGVGPSLGSESADNFVHGVVLVRDLFLTKLESLGVSRVPSLGQRFDAAQHEAVTTTTVSDPAQDGTVIAVVKEGYTINGELLRPASVVVGVAQAPVGG
jgi:molecular chaperone GrpE